MFVVEIFCGLAVVAAHNGTKLERKFITEEFDCHLELRNMNDDQFYYMANDEYTVFSNQHIYDNVKTETRRDAVTGENLYTMHIKFTGNPKKLQGLRKALLRRA